MKPKILVMLVLASCVFQPAVRAAANESPSTLRTFEFTYTATLAKLPSGSHDVRIWIPMATTDSHQTVVLEKVQSPFTLRRTRAPEYGNRMFYAEFHTPQSSLPAFTMIYRVTRREYSKGDFKSLMKFDSDPARPSASVERFLLPDRLVPVGGKLGAIAQEATRGDRGDIEKAHAIYDYVFHSMRYDKSGVGWGRGDALWACDAHHGNCTDFHSLFISMARSEKIPARFSIGFPLPADTHEGIVPGYHCWAEFYAPGAGWVPVDISEAWLDKSKYDYFFGSVDANRVRFSRGRDLTLSPKQAGPPVNYFVYPYVEVDGRPFRAGTHFAFRDLGQATRAKQQAEGTQRGAEHGSVSTAGPTAFK
jgi:transglutaminase-like putative cysteine protease